MIQRTSRWLRENGHFLNSREIKKYEDPQTGNDEFHKEMNLLFSVTEMNNEVISTG